MTKHYLLAAIWLIAFWLVAFSSGQVSAQTLDTNALEPPRVSGPVSSEFPGLTLANLFSAGWNEEWARRERTTGTPDLPLLRVQTNFLERDLRVNFQNESNIRGTKRENVSALDGYMAWSFNRRLMIELFGVYEWVDARTGQDLHGGTPALGGRLQLVDTESSSYSFNVKVTPPDRGIGEHRSAFTYGLAGFEDLAYWFQLDRVGLYYSLVFDSYAGRRPIGARQNDVVYDVTLAKTLTGLDAPIFSQFTIFLENCAQTNLDGSNAGHTVFTITPGFTFNLGGCRCVRLGRDNWLMFGIDIPVSGPKPWDAVYRASYVMNF